jgi:5-methyltetrahydrofolate--homocysteine methyltransferase
MAKEASEIASRVKSDPLGVINAEIIPALNEIGQQFEDKKAYLPQLLMSADAASGAISELKKLMPTSSDGGKGAVILATVKGDIHDIGKNIVKVLLESYGFKVHDLGRDVSPDDVLNAVKNIGCKLVGLSALMTTTVPSMEKTVTLLHKYDPKIKVMVGGAVLNEEYARNIGADKYSPDAMGAVRFAEEFYGI